MNISDICRHNSLLLGFDLLVVTLVTNKKMQRTKERQGRRGEGCFWVLWRAICKLNGQDFSLF